MSEWIEIRINGRTVRMPKGMTVAVALAQAGETTFRRSVGGRERGPLCGMGVCMECRVTINGLAHCRSCMTLCEPNMEIVTGE
jgi:aerobic-type carbon monoxide dehydrogenase small subunit (CoxS/CutS family)